MWTKIAAFFTAILVFIAELFGLPTTDLKFHTYENLSYGEHERHTLDLIIPKHTEETGLILYIHGGAWIGGDKDGYRSTLTRMAEKHGVACAAINYRYICSDIDLNDLMDDIDAAMVCIKETGKKHGTDINRSILTGGSAGGHLSLLYSYSRVENSAIPPVAVMSDCGPTDLSDDYYYYNEDLGKPSGLGDYATISEILTWACGETVTFDSREDAAQAIAKVSPLTYVNEKTVPTIINHGMMDDIVPFRNAQALEAKLTQCGVEHVFNIYPNSGHGLDLDPENARHAAELFDHYIQKFIV